MDGKIPRVVLGFLKFFFFNICCIMMRESSPHEKSVDALMSLYGYAVMHSDGSETGGGGGG